MYVVLILIMSTLCSTLCSISCISLLNSRVLLPNKATFLLISNAKERYSYFMQVFIS